MFRVRHSAVSVCVKHPFSCHHLLVSVKRDMLDYDYKLYKSHNLHMTLGNDITYHRISAFMLDP